jgi:hypothetical protein
VVAVGRLALRQDVRVGPQLLERVGEVVGAAVGLVHGVGVDGDEARLLGLHLAAVRFDICAWHGALLGCNGWTRGGRIDGSTARPAG